MFMLVLRLPRLRRKRSRLLKTCLLSRRALEKSKFELSSAVGKEKLLQPQRRRCSVIGAVIALVTALAVTNTITALTVQAAAERSDCSPDDEMASTVFSVGGGWDMAPLMTTKLVARSTHLIERYLTSYGPPESGFVVASSETKIYKGGGDGERSLAYVLNTESTQPRTEPRTMPAD